MKKGILVLITVATFVLSGCGDKEARDYARKLIPVLDGYQQQLTAKIKEEKKSYERLADAYVGARKDDIMIRLASQRVNRSMDAADTLVADGEVPTRSELVALLQDYAKTDFDMTRSLLQEGMDSRSRYLADVENIELELQKVKLLKEALTQLAKPDSDVKRLKAAAEAIAKTKDATTKLMSAEVQAQIDQLKTSAQSAAKDKGKKSAQ
jgi:hypothetical protein